MGLVRRPHGLQGELSVEPVTSFPERFHPGARLIWRRGGEERPLTLAGARPHGARWLLQFEDVGDVAAARSLSGGELVVPATDAVAPPEGFYYSHLVEGWDCADRRGARLGMVAGLEQTPAGPLLSVTTAEGKAVLVPFVDGIVVEVDETARRIVLDPPEGLFDL